jgi:hypothetical protein
VLSATVLMRIPAMLKQTQRHFEQHNDLLTAPSDIPSLVSVSKGNIERCFWLGQGQCLALPLARQPIFLRRTMGRAR